MKWGEHQYGERQYKEQTWFALADNLFALSDKLPHPSPELPSTLSDLNIVKLLSSTPKPSTRRVKTELSEINANLPSRKISRITRKSVNLRHFNDENMALHGFGSVKSAFMARIRSPAKQKERHPRGALFYI